MERRNGWTTSNRICPSCAEAGRRTRKSLKKSRAAMPPSAAALPCSAGRAPRPKLSSGCSASRSISPCATGSPFIQDVVPRIEAARVAAVCLAPQYSEMSIGLYIRKVEETEAALRDPMGEELPRRAPADRSLRGKTRPLSRAGPVHRPQSPRARPRAG